jgi:hypothetical protein
MHQVQVMNEKDWLFGAEVDVDVNYNGDGWTNAGF